MARRCKTCGYWRTLGTDSYYRACHYMLDTGKSKGCRAENCDKYKSREDMPERKYNNTIKSIRKTAPPAGTGKRG